MSDFKAFIEAEIFADKQVPPIPLYLKLPNPQIAMQLNFLPEICVLMYEYIVFSISFKMKCFSSSIAIMFCLLQYECVYYLYG